MSLLSRAAGVALRMGASRTMSTVAVRGAVCFERYPMVHPTPTAYEQEYARFQEKIHVEKSALLLDEYNEMLAQEKRKKGIKTEEEERQEALAKLGFVTQESKEKFTPASIITEADKAGDLKSQNRALEKKLFFVVKSKGAWRFPEVAHAEGEAVRKTAERALGEAVGEQLKNKSLQAYFISNAPSLCITEGSSKTFVYRAAVVGGAVASKGKYDDYLWLTADELPKYLSKDYHAAVAKFIF